MGPTPKRDRFVAAAVASRSAGWIRGPQLVAYVAFFLFGLASVPFVAGEECQAPPWNPTPGFPGEGPPSSDVPLLSTASAPAPVDVAAAGLAGVAAAQLAPAPAGDGGAAAGEAMELVAAQGLVGALAAPAGVPVQQPFACQECGKEFLSQRGLLCHGTHAHGRQRPSAAFVLGPICPGCGNNYRTRARAMEHVERGSARCRTAVLEAGLVPADPVAVAAADDADRIRRRQARQAGLSELAGPPAILHRGA